MQQVANDLLNLCLFKDERVFFFPRLTYNLVFLFRLCNDPTLVEISYATGSKRLT